MKDKYFLDTNILLYLLSNDEKKIKSKELIKSLHTISVQVLNEFANVSVKKFKFTTQETKKYIDTLSTKVVIENYTKETILYALDIKHKYKLQFYDSLIIATAIENKCTVLYSEDMQNGLLVENVLTIINPFKELE